MAQALAEDAERRAAACVTRVGYDEDDGDSKRAGQVQAARKTLLLVAPMGRCNEWQLIFYARAVAAPSLLLLTSQLAS